MAARPPVRTPVRVVYSDLDGTMVGPYGCFFHDVDAQPTLEPARALVDLLATDLQLVLVSGRTRPQLQEACRIFGADGYVGEMGAVLGWDRATRSSVLRGAMPETYDTTPVQVLHDLGVVDRLFERYAGQLEYHAPWHLGHDADVMLRGSVDVVEAQHWLADAAVPWARLRDNGMLPRRGLAAVDGPVHVYHLMPDGLSKGQGVAADLARRGLCAQDAVAVGDSVSDLEMAPYVARLFLVANGAAAPATATAAAALDNVTVCTGTNGSGWVEAVRWALQSR